MTSSTPGALPPLPSPPGGLVIFSPTAWHWIVGVLRLLYAADQAQFAVLGPLVQSQEGIMSTLADLNTQLDAIKASETAEQASLATLGTALTTIITDLQALPPVGVLTQADLDAVVQKATDDATAAASNAATGAAQSTQAGAAVPPAPAPPSP